MDPGIWPIWVDQVACNHDDCPCTDEESVIVDQGIETTLDELVVFIEEHVRKWGERG